VVPNAESRLVCVVLLRNIQAQLRVWREWTVEVDVLGLQTVF